MLFSLAPDSKLRACDLLSLAGHRSAAQDEPAGRRYARILERWVRDMGPDAYQHNTHLLRRTKAFIACELAERDGPRYHMPKYQVIGRIYVAC